MRRWIPGGCAAKPGLRGPCYTTNDNAWLAGIHIAPARTAFAARIFAGQTGQVGREHLAGIASVRYGAIEALFAARIHPERKADTLTAEEIENLYRAIRQVLALGIQNRGTTFSDYRDAEGREGRNQEYLRVFRRTGQPCPRYGTPIERTVVGGRGTYFCPRCQK